MVNMHELKTLNGSHEHAQIALIVEEKMLSNQCDVIR